MGVRTVGIEEELLLVDPGTRGVSSRAHEVLKEFREHGAGRGSGPRPATDELEQELFRHQLETRTDPTTDLGDALAQVVAARHTAGEAARATDLALVAAGVVPAGDAEPDPTRNDRYQHMLATYGDVARAGGTCGMHVHVAIDSDDEGVRVIDRLAPWLPIVLALSANSPFYRGTDTGYASWRAQVWSRWPSAGPTEPFGSAAGYRRVAQELIDLGAARDTGMLYFDARLSEGNPTVEVRTPDVCTDPEDAVLVAALVRGLVTTLVADDAPGAAPADGPAAGPWRVETLRAAQWRASRYAVSDRLVHPVDRSLAPARDVVQALVDAVRPALDDAGDTERVEAGVDRVLHAGGAARQRAAYERGGSVDAVVDDLVARTEATWAPSGA